MKTLQKLTRNGNSHTVAIPRPMLTWLEWLPGSLVVVQLNEDRTITLRQLDERDIAPRKSPRVVLDPTLPGML